MLVLKYISDPRQITGIKLLRMVFLVFLIDKCWPNYPLLNIYYKFPVVMKPGTVILKLKRIQKMNKSRVAVLEFC